MMAIGIGAKGNSNCLDIMTAIEAVERAAGRKASIIATISEAPFEDSTRQAAQNASATFQTQTLAALQERAYECQTLSKRVLKVFGVGSIAEAAALAAAGPGSTLVVTRLTVGFVTAAAALSKDHMKVRA